MVKLMKKTMKYDLYLKNAQVVTEEEIFNGGVLIDGENISRLIHGDEDVEAVQELDLDGKVLLPGVVDGHVHFNEPGRAEWEGYRTGSMAAAAGGVTTFLEMPLNSYPGNASEFISCHYKSRTIQQ